MSCAHQSWFALSFLFSSSALAPSRYFSIAASAAVTEPRVLLKLSPLIGGPKLLRLHSQLFVDSGAGINGWDFVPKDATAPATLARLVTLRAAPGDCAAFDDNDLARPPTQMSFLRLDLRVECDTAEHDSIRNVAWIYFVLWPVGCPLLYLLLLLLARKAKLNGDRTGIRNATRFLWREHRTMCKFAKALPLRRL